MRSTHVCLHYFDVVGDRLDKRCTGEQENAGVAIERGDLARQWHMRCSLDSLDFAYAFYARDTGYSAADDHERVPVHLKKK